MTTCPCCSSSMLRQLRHQQMFWFCRSCWQEMPLIDKQGLSLASTTLDQRLIPKQERSLVTR